MPELPQNAADHVHDLGALPGDQIASSMDGKHSVPILRLDLDKAHAWSTHRFANRLGIRSICFAALHMGFDTGCWHELNVMTELAQFASPVMG